MFFQVLGWAANKFGAGISAIKRTWGAPTDRRLTFVVAGGKAETHRAYSDAFTPPAWAVNTGRCVWCTLALCAQSGVFGLKGWRQAMRGIKMARGCLASDLQVTGGAKSGCGSCRGICAGGWAAFAAVHHCQHWQKDRHRLHHRT